MTTSTSTRRSQMYVIFIIHRNDGTRAVQTVTVLAETLLGKHLLDAIRDNDDCPRNPAIHHQTIGEFQRLVQRVIRCTQVRAQAWQARSTSTTIRTLQHARRSGPLPLPNLPARSPSLQSNLVHRPQNLPPPRPVFVHRGREAGEPEARDVQTPD